MSEFPEALHPSRPANADQTFLQFGSECLSPKSSSHTSPSTGGNCSATKFSNIFHSALLGRCHPLGQIPCTPLGTASASFLLHFLYSLQHTNYIELHMFCMFQYFCGIYIFTIVVINEIKRFSFASSGSSRFIYFR